MEPSAENLAAASPYDDDLAEAINFNEEDLDANVHGTMTAWQKRYKIRRRLRESYGVVSSFLLIALFLLFSSRRLAANASSPTLIYGTVVVVLGFLAFFAYRGGGSVIPKVLRDLSANKAGRISGVMAHETRTINNVTHYYVKIDAVRLKVRKPVYDAMIEGAAYTLYYAPHTMTLLAAAPLNV